MAIIFDSLTATATNHLAAFSPVWVTGLEKTDWAPGFLQLNYRVGVEIFFGAEVYADFEVRPNSDGTFRAFNISTHLTQKFNLLDLPDLSATSDLYTGASYQFNIRYQERWTGSSESFQTDAKTYVANASALQILDQYDPEFLTYTSPTNTLAQWMTKFDTPVQFAAIPFGLCIAYEEGPTFVNYSWKYSDPAVTGYTPDGSQSVELQTGINFIAMSHPSSQSFVWVWLREIPSNNQVSAVQKIEIRPQPICYTQMAWVNDLGGIDLWCFLGPKSEEAEQERGEVFSGDFLEAPDAQQRTDEIVLEIKERRTTTLAEEAIPAQIARGLAEMLTSVQVAELGEGWVWKPKQVKGRDYIFNDNDETGNQFSATIVEPERRKPTN